jgi:hypothetical protein
MLSVGSVDRAEDVHIDVLCLESLESTHDTVERAETTCIDPIRIMELLWAIHGKAHEEIVLLEEDRPILIDEGAICLDCVGDPLMRLAVFVDEFHRSTKEVESHHGWLPTLPRHRHIRREMRLQKLADVGLKQIVCHPEAVSGVQHLFG